VKPYRSCSCCDPGTGRPYPRGQCPAFDRKGHSRWYARFEAPPGPDGKHRQPRIGPFPTRKDAELAVAEAIGDVAAGKHPSDRKTTLGQRLPRWLG
jgi:hypothetical protein